MALTKRETSVIQVDTSNIERNPRQPRQWFNNDELEQLTISVREHGVIQPLIVVPSSKPDVYVLIAGERRLICIGQPGASYGRSYLTQQLAC